MRGNAVWPAINGAVVADCRDAPPLPPWIRSGAVCRIVGQRPDGKPRLAVALAFDATGTVNTWTLTGRVLEVHDGRVVVQPDRADPRERIGPVAIHGAVEDLGAGDPFIAAGRFRERRLEAAWIRRP
ncbi:MAG TPA: hypothetical protein ENK57_03350, partial [Polyangiaceae bacterium]|nr:hypothetical protein [Polyangiaceae bacterium]